MRKKSRLVALVLLVLLSNIMSTVAQPVPIGETVQSNPFESNPTVGSTSGVVGLVGNEANARDGDFGTNVNWRIGGALSSVTAFVEMQVFENNPPSGQFTVGWIDVKINYRASVTTDDRYRIVYQVAPDTTWRILVGWISGATAKFDYTGAQDERVWSNVIEPNNGVWDWTDITNVKVRVETQRAATAEDSAFNRFYLYDVWLTIYEGTYPDAPLNVLSPPGPLDKYYDADNNGDWTDPWVTPTEFGEPAIRDVNSNGIFDLGLDVVLMSGALPSGAALSVPGAFDKYHDANRNGVWNSWTDTNYNGILDAVDFIEPAVRDVNNNGVFDFATDALLTGIQPPASVSIQPRVILGLVAGDIFFIDVSVSGATRMHGFQFRIDYDTNVLTAADFFAYSPFVTRWPSEINDDPWGNGTGYVAMAFVSYMGDPVGFTGNEPVVRIFFMVDSDGTSLLHFNDSMLTTILGTTIPHTVDDGVFTTNPVHDVAVTDVRVSTTQVMPGGTVATYVSVMNQGTFSETFDVTVLYDTTVIGTQTITSLDAAYSMRLFFIWDTSQVPFEHYQIKAEASTIAEETETEDNTRFLPDTVIVGRHDIAVTEVLRAYPSPDEAVSTSIGFLNVSQGENVYINVTVVNLGTFTEILDLTTSYWSNDEPFPGLRIIGFKTGISLAPSDSLTFNFTWNTIDVRFRPPMKSPSGAIIYFNNTLCEIRANVTQVQYEKGNGYDYRGNNVFEDGWVNVTTSKPEARFYLNPLEPFVGQPVEFDARLSRTTTGTTLERFEWNFGDDTIETYVVGLNATLPHVATHTFATAGAYRVNLTVWNNAGFNNTYSYPWPVQVHMRDNAILSVAANATTVPIGGFVAINVTVKNEGGQFEPRVHVTVYFDETAIDTQTVLGLHSGYADTLIFSLNTIGLSPGTYAIRAVVEPLPYEIDTYDNTLTDGVITLFSWDHVFEDGARSTTLKLNTEHRFFQFITPTKDYGIKHDPDMTVRTHTIIIRFEDAEIKLHSITIDTHIELCLARAQDMQTGETYWLLQRPQNWKVGDTNYDGVVDILDVAVISAHWSPNPPQGTLGYDPNADMNNDGTVDILDIAIASSNWSK